MSSPIPFQLPEACRPASGRHPDSPPKEPYVASAALVRAVNLAIYLRRPLLLEGEAGCGKSRLARHVAHELGLPLYEWPVRSTSRAHDGLYTYDAILRLHDVHLRQAHAQEATAERDPGQPLHYVSYGALGKAFKSQECPAVVLIDEIDKADIDFPNDLLTVLEEPWRFEIKETSAEPVQAKHPPIVIITSNQEKGNLPAPFLRRCIYFYVDFPSGTELQNIVAAHYARKQEQNGIDPPAPELQQTAVSRFLEERNRAELHKKPGTSEFLDWLEALRGFAPLPGLLETLVSTGAALPYPELLFKIREDWARHAART